jgi:hypothetical protein
MEYLFIRHGRGYPYKEPYEYCEVYPKWGALLKRE